MSKFCTLLIALAVLANLVQCDIQQSLISTINEWDEKHVTYNIIGDWVKIIRVDEHPRSANYDDHYQSAAGLLGRVDKFLSSHRLNIKLPVSEARSSKFKRFLIPFVVLMVLKKSIEVPIMLGVLSILAFKGLGAGLISLMLSSATALKSLLEHHTSSKVSYEVVPQVNHWSRAGMDYPNFETNVGPIGGYPYHTLPNGAR